MPINDENKLDIIEYAHHKLEFKTNDNQKGFSHNFRKDLQFIILWENGRYKEKEVLNKISSSFNILYCAEVNWSEKHRQANFNRLYAEKINSKNNLEKQKNVGFGPFICIVFEDENPNYGYIQSLSGSTSIGNTNAVELKRRLRTLLEGNFVHGSSGIEEFFHHATLLFHEKNLKDILTKKEWNGIIEKIEQDLAGADGWKDFSELFVTSNLCANWLVLRNFEFFPNDFWENDKDIDILCEKLSLFTSVVNASKRSGNIDAYEIMVEGRMVPLDIRHLGDYYYDPVWQYKMLKRKSFYNSNIPRVRDDDYFFSLLYHAKLQKKVVKNAYIPRLIELAKKIGLKEFSDNDIYDDEKAAAIVNGFLKEQGYCFYTPVDSGVYLNKKVYKYITAKPYKEKISIKNRSLKLFFSLLPSSMKSIVPLRLKLIVKRALRIV
jgi:hypothetical protein